MLQEGVLPGQGINDRKKASNKESIHPKEKQRLPGSEKTCQAKVLMWQRGARPAWASTGGEKGTVRLNIFQSIL